MRLTRAPVAHILLLLSLLSFSFPEKYGIKIGRARSLVSTQAYK